MREHILNFDFASQGYKYFTTIDIKRLNNIEQDQNGRDDLKKAA